MKKIFFGLIVFVFVACNNASDTSSNDEDTTVTNVSGIDNVNGNMPDTTNTISIDASSQSGDAVVDTLPKNK
jgi:activator of HSP90 ATPase